MLHMRIKSLARKTFCFSRFAEQHKKAICPSLKKHIFN